MNVAALATTAALLFFSGIPAHSEEVEVPQRLQVLLDSYEREKERVLKPLERKLDTALVDLRDQFTKAGRLQDALAVNNLISSRGAEHEANKPPEDTRWRWGSGGELMLKGDGTAKHTSWDKWGTWNRQKDGAILLTSQYGDSTIRFTDENTGVVSSHKSGGSTALTKVVED
ncbi:MAG: hypothetical protein P1U86_03365 [Verrucomicrobiales bacterium]|nr:hypothetical protein [Verrucomicrobiales bacterium]